MEVEKCDKQVKCDFYGCPNMANFSFKTGKLLGSKMHFCQNCLQELYHSIGEFLIPKSPKTPFKQKKVK